jgi:hypothetical protein
MKKQVLAIFCGVFLLIQSIGAQTWEEAKRLTRNSGDSFAPTIATDSNNNIHVVWDDSTPGNAEIYYKKGIQ